MRGFAAGLLLVVALGAACPAGASDPGVNVVAAENFYGDIARQLAGDRISLVSIMTNPGEDPHLFEVTPGIVRKVAAAQIVVLNGAGYD
ncbi:MAG TPA: zinc ABC transporter substrate-binding protein, partial [Pseudolabrys sp.]|nr:zinc ABC transporter substrate-binding protein [Pseudolabrys sp.]